jgi:serine/threonine-protein phosphatase PGAM5
MAWSAFGIGLAVAVAPATGPPGPPATRTLYLVRHRAYDPKAAASDDLGPGLTPLGVAQVRLLGARLAPLPGRWDGLLASPLRRAQDTARVLAKDLNLTIETVPELAECTPESRRPDLNGSEKPEAMAACAAGLDKLFAARFKPADGAERRELLVCHGNVIRYLVTRVLGVDSKAWLEMSIGHASVTVVRIEANGAVRVVSVGDVGHLPFNMQTGSAADASRDLAMP